MEITMTGAKRLSVALLVTTCYFFVGVTSFSPKTRRLTQWSAQTCPSFQHGSMKFRNLMYSSSSSELTTEASEVKLETSMRSRLRRITGFSLTALRATMRTATGISLTALYLSALAISGVWIRQTMRIILDIFPTWARYFVQPFLVMYYVPLFMLRNMTAPKRREQEMEHDTLVESWKQAVVVAEHSRSYWPIHVNENGEIESIEDELDVNDAVAKSVEIALEVKRDS